MIVAKSKRESNVVEYLLYMWQIEDIIRACKFDMDIINRSIVEKFDTTVELKDEIYSWYENLAVMMEKENVKESGHLQINKNFSSRLYDLHIELLNSNEVPSYHALNDEAQPSIALFKEKFKGDSTNIIELMVTALYSVVMMKLNKQEISKDTIAAVQSFSRLLAVLSDSFLKVEKGDLEL